jgi:hypothetical protein
MVRDNPAVRNLIEFSYSGLADEQTFVAAILEKHRADLSSAGVAVRETQRGAVPGRVIVTIGPGAEIPGARLVSWLEAYLSASAPTLQNTEVYVHPYCLPRPIFFELPKQALDARRQLLDAARSQPLPALADPLPAHTGFAAAPALT